MPSLPSSTATGESPTAASSGAPHAADGGRTAPGPSSLHVCLVGPSMDIVGGQSIVLDRLLSRFRETEGITVSFIPVNPRLPGLLGAMQRIKYLRTIVTSVAYVFSLLRHLRDVDVVHAFSASYWSFLLAPFPAMLVGRLYGKAVVLNYHSGEADDHLATWRTAAPLARLAHTIAVPSGYLVEVFARHGLEASAIFNFVETERIQARARPAPRPRFLTNRNLEPMYGVDCTLRAFARVQRSYPDAELVVAGEGSERRSLESLADTLQLRNVRFLGRVAPDEMPDLYSAADIYLNASTIDNMPSSIIEAFAAGLPVVTTDAGGIPFIVRHDHTGLMVPVGDDAALAEQALRLLREPGLALRLAECARAECLERYVWPAVRDAWVRLYRDTRTRCALGGTPARTGAAG